MVNLIKSYISDGEVNTSRKNRKSASDDIQTESLKMILIDFKRGSASALYYLYLQENCCISFNLL